MSPVEESALDPELEEQLGVFREFINSLDVDDLEKPKQGVSTARTRKVNLSEFASRNIKVAGRLCFRDLAICLSCPEQIRGEVFRQLQRKIL